jgi:hypothetical protein
MNGRQDNLTGTIYTLISEENYIEVLKILESEFIRSPIRL